MAHARSQHECAIALTNTTITPGPGSNEIEDCSYHAEGNGMVSIVAGSSWQYAMDEFKLLWGLRKYLVLLGILAVSVTYNAGLTPPGGFWTLNEYGHIAGDPVLRVTFYQRHELFFYFNATALAASLLLLVLLLSKRVTRHKLWLRSMQFTMILDLFSLMGAYAAGSCRALKSSIYVLILVIAVFVYVGIHILVSIRVIPEALKEKVRAKLIQILPKWCIHDEERSSHQEKEVEEARKFILMLVTFVATVTYQAGLSPPGGFWSDNDNDAPRYKHPPATSVLRSNYLGRYNIFVVFNSTSFVASLVTVILLLSKELSTHGIRSKAVVLCVVVDLLCLVGAYAAGCCRAVATSIYVTLIIIVVLIFFALLAVTFTYKPVADWLVNIKSKYWDCMDAVGRALSSTYGSIREQDNSSSRHQASIRESVAITEDKASETEHQSDDNQGHRLSQGEQENSASRHQASVHETSPAEYEASEREHQSNDNQGHILSKGEQENSSSCHQASVHETSLAEDKASETEHQSDDNQGYRLNKGEQESSASRHQDSVHETLPAEDKASETEHQSDDNQGHRLSKGEQENSASRCQDPVHETSPAEDKASKTEHQFDGNQQISDTIKMESSEELLAADKQQVVTRSVFNSQYISNTKEIESPDEQPPLDKQNTVDTKETVSNSIHPAGDNQQSENTEDVVCNLYNQSTISLFTNMNESMSSTDHLSAVNCQQTTYTNDGISAEDQQEASKKGQCSTNYIKSMFSPMEGFSKQNMSANRCNRATGNITSSEVPSVPAQACEHADGSEQHMTVEIGRIIRDPEPAANVHVYSGRGAPGQIVDDNPTEKHLNKTRTYLLLLSILAVSLTYQSGLNPPGGFWSRSENEHSAGDRILEDTYHPRFIAFFYVNAIAFVASIIMIILLLNKLMSEKVTKRRALPIAMIVNLLSLTVAFVLGSSREAKKSTYSSVLVGLVLAYVAVHVLLAIHVIPKKWRTWDHESKSSSGPALPKNRTEDDLKEFGRRRNLLLILAILAATVTYQAGMNPPGGVWSDDKDVSGKPGNPVLQDTHSKRYDVFYYSNSISFVSSLVITILLVNKESCEHGIKSYALRVCLVVGLLGLLIAYTAGCCRNRKQSIYLIAIAVAVLVSLAIQVLLSSIYGELLSQFMDCLQSCLFGAKKVQQDTPVLPEASEHVEKEVKILKKKHKYLMLLAILAASITYQAGLNPPGGFWSGNAGHAPGNPILHDVHRLRYDLFFCFNSFSFMASIVVIMLLLINSVRKKDVPLEVLRVIMILDLLALMTAFAVGSCRRFWTSLYVYALVIGVVIWLLLLIVLSSKVAKFLLRRRFSSHTDPKPASRTNTLAPGQ
ncbi:uncharacterized protein LOC102721934 [Oryza brachyantha]|nr:uncharacterized protein LOC102721934 [Oryza brachyantha]